MSTGPNTLPSLPVTYLPFSLSDEERNRSEEKRDEIITQRRHTSHFGVGNVIDALSVAGNLLIKCNLAIGCRRRMLGFKASVLCKEIMRCLLLDSDGSIQSPLGDDPRVMICK